jgi:non-specific protein-tyrosine kinase
MTDLQQYFKGVLRWWWLIALSTVIAAGASYYVSQQQPKIYQTATTLMVGQAIQKANPTNNDFYTSQLLAESYAQMAVRQPILQATIESLDLPLEWQWLRGQVYAAPLPQTQLLSVAVEDTSPERAVAIADEIAYQLILQSPTSPENAERQERGAFVQKELDDLESRIDAAKTRIQELEGELAVALSASDIQSLQTEIASLDSLITTWQGNYANLLSFLDGTDTPNYLTVIEPAQMPWAPVRPNVSTNVLLAAMVGFTLALGAALLLEYLDDTVKSPDDISQSLDLTVLGSIVRLKGKNNKDRLVTSQGLFSSAAEAYRLIRTNLQFTAIDQSVKSIMVTSSNPGEGKSTTAANLAMVMAQSELKTILVDTDLRKPTMHKLFSLSNLSGITDLLRSPDLNPDSHLKATSIQNLQVITSGPLPPNPAEMLGSKRMVELIECLEELADVVIFDSPPVLAVTDSSILANRVDGVIVVCQAKRTRRKTIKEAVRRLKKGNTMLLGVVLNQASKSAGYYYYSQSYGYSSAQSSAAPDSTQRRWWQRRSATE